MEGLMDSSFQSRLDPALSAPPLPFSSKAFPRSSPIRKAPHLNSPKKTRKPNLYQKSEPAIDEPHSGCKKGGELPFDERSDVDDISSTDICHIKRQACYNDFSSLCGESEIDQLLTNSVRKDVVEVVQEEKEKGVECSMCGDVGIAELLFFCSKCCLRPQHIYCGRHYPNVCEETLVCNWCLHDQDSSTSTIVEEHHSRSPAPDGYTDHEDLVEIVGLHGKAFDYLLLAAAQSSLPQLISDASDESKKLCQTASKVNITGCKIMTCSRKRTDWGSDKKTKSQGLTENNIRSVARIISNDRERSMKRLVKKLNIEVQSAVNKIYLEQRNCDHDDSGENAHKRQRCSKAANADVTKNKTRGLQMSPARPNNRRYKLLADVVC